MNQLTPGYPSGTMFFWVVFFVIYQLALWVRLPQSVVLLW